MLLPVIHAIRKTYPDAKIDFLTLDKNKYVSYYVNVFDNVYMISEKNVFWLARSVFMTLTSLFKKNYDIVIDFEQFARFSALISFLIGRKIRVGFNTAGQHREFLYTDSVVYNNSIHMTKSFLSVAEAAGAFSRESAAVIPYLKRDPKEGEDILKCLGLSEKDLLIILHVGTSANFSLIKRWPEENFAELADRLIHNYNAKIIFTGLPEENSIVKKAIHNINTKENVINACGTLSFNQFVAIVGISDLVVSCDTSTVHIASCLSVPVVGLYGPSAPILYGPWSKNSIYFYKKLGCSPCSTNYNAKVNKCRNPRGQGLCMKMITMGEVFEEIKNNYLKEGSAFRIKKLYSDAKINTLSEKYIKQ